MRTAPFLALFTAQVLFGTGYASSAVVVDELPHQVAALLRFTGGAVVLAVLVLATRRRRPVGTPRRPRHLLRSGMLGLLGVSLFSMLVFWGLSLAPALDGSILIPLMAPVFTKAALLIAGKERLPRRQSMAMLPALAGGVVFFLALPPAGEPSSSTGRLCGDAIYVLAAAVWAAYTILSKARPADVDPLRANAVGAAVGAAALLLPALPSLPDLDWGLVSPVAWLNVAYLAAGPTAAAYLLFHYGARRVGPSVAAMTMLVIPFSGVICTTLFLGESFTSGQVIGSSMMLAGAVLAAARPGPAPRPEAEIVQPHARTDRLVSVSNMDSAGPIEQAP